MAHKHRSSAFLGGGGDHVDDPQTSSEHGGTDSPISGDDSQSRSTAAALSPNKRRRAVQKRVVSVRIGDVEGSRWGGGGSGEAYPPSDSWAWRKYGQKPIKGSPFPRGYYRCSSSKGCPARKQVERSRVDPTMLQVTYAGDHNHPVPTSKTHHSSATSAPVPTTPVTNHVNAEVDDDEDRMEESFSCAVELGLGGAALVDCSWLSEAVAFEAPCFVGPRCDDSDSDVAMVHVGLREEDELLFADLDELPECSAVFPRGISTCNLAAAGPLCSRTAG